MELPSGVFVFESDKTNIDDAGAAIVIPTSEQVLSKDLKMSFYLE